MGLYRSRVKAEGPQSKRWTRYIAGLDPSGFIVQGRRIEKDPGFEALLTRVRLITGGANQRGSGLGTATIQVMSAFAFPA